MGRRLNEVNNLGQPEFRSFRGRVFVSASFSTHRFFWNGSGCHSKSPQGSVNSNVVFSLSMVRRSNPLPAVSAASARSVFIALIPKRLDTEVSTHYTSHVTTSTATWVRPKRLGYLGSQRVRRAATLRLIGAHLRHRGWSPFWCSPDRAADVRLITILKLASPSHHQP